MFKSKDWLDAIVRHINPPETRHGMVRLDKSERTTPFPDDMFKEFLGSIHQEDFMVYPETAALVARLSEFLNLSENHILIGPGIDSIIKSFFEGFVEVGDRIVITDPCFPMYQVYADLFRAEVTKIPYNQNLRLDFNRLLESIEGTVAVFLANPNSPLGDYQDEANIRILAEKAALHNTLVFIDEAYIEFAPGSAIHLINEHPNLAIARTFSKAMGGAGIRVGYLAGGEQLVARLAKWRPMYEINQIGVRFALFLLDHYEEVEAYAKQCITERDSLISDLKKAEFDTLPSHTNFIHFHGGERQGKARQALQRHNILFKTAVLPHDPRTDWIRLSVGPEITKAPFIQEILKS